MGGEVMLQQAKASKGRRKPGRPKPGIDYRDLILDAAELIFADEGFAGSKMRDIANRAGVNQALIRYYFGSKEDLFDEVYRRRGALLSGRRHVLLDEVLARPTSLRVEDIVLAYLAPQWEMKHSGPAGAAFVRLQARLHAEPAEHSFRLRREVYDSSVKRFVNEIALLTPDIPKDIISLRMAFLVGTYLFMLNDLGRLNDLTDGQLGVVGKDEMLKHLAAFLTAGLRAPVPD
ncbi:TetR/AcrR family transcriptional regulator [Agrobacterium tumefaciens]|uniref:TetR/AcrR family transcriptional regulator n=1 Tax=Agrobacterium tumefaciens complex TaxID=1183400 RepID=UPI001FA96589|nr:TetR/AcrR family transcriptional regulator [Agrobacterium tumefaciens]UNZ52548.1 TetR family transcriptional regulator [Agrobacterium tumefaciens]